MKIFLGLFAVLLALNGVWTLPAKSPNDDAEVISVPHRTVSDEAGPDFTDFRGVIDTGSGYPFLQPNPQPFSFNFGVFDAFDDIIRRFRQRVWPVVGDDSDSTEIGSRGSFDLDSKNGNSTSTVKVVNGHKIEVNETVYGDDDSTFRVRIVNIRPIESGEDVEETVHTSVGSGKSGANNPVTSAPAAKDKESNEDSDETREPLERDNEIRNNLNEQKISESTKNEGNILSVPTTTTATTTTTIVKTSSEDNRNVILNATFVTDNSFKETENKNGNIEAETNKPTENKMMVKYDETNVAGAAAAAEEAEAAAALSAASQGETESESEVATTTVAALDEEAQTNSPIDAIAEAAEDVISSVSAGVQDASLTIENNEETETNDNFNESSEDAGDAAAVVDMTKDPNKLSSNGNAEIEQEENTSSTLELNSEVVVPVTSAIETFSAEHFENDGGDVENVEAARLTRENLMKEREREDYASSSDDEGAEPIEMNPVFNAEWENLAEDLASTNDQNNDLSNDIDIYESVPVDLSNDIAVNEIAAAQPDFPINPDAEFIDTNGVINNGASMPKFEKLSLSTSLQPEGMMMNPAK